MKNMKNEQELRRMDYQELSDLLTLIKTILSEKTEGLTMTFTCEGHKYKKHKTPFAALVDDNLQVVEWLESIKTEVSGSWTTKTYQIDESFIGNTIMLTDAKCRYFRIVKIEQGKLVLA